MKPAFYRESLGFLECCSLSGPSPVVRYIFLPEIDFSSDILESSHAYLRPSVVSPQDLQRETHVLSSSERNLRHGSWHPHARPAQGLQLGSSRGRRHGRLLLRGAETEGQTAQAADRRARRNFPRHPAWRDLLPARPERSRQVHNRRRS